MNIRIKKTLALFLSLALLLTAIAAPLAAGAADKAAESPDSAHERHALEKEAKAAYDSAQEIPMDVRTEVKEASARSGKALAESAVTGAEEESASLPAYIEGDAFVYFRNDFNFDGFDSRIIIEKTKTFAEGTGMERKYAVVHSDTMTTQEIINSLKDNEYVDSVVPDTIAQPTAITNDQYSSLQWALENTGQNNGDEDVDINPENLWSVVENNDTECVVAVLDTGVDYTHEDLKSILWKNTLPELEGYGLCGYDFTGTVADGSPRDDTGHGTHIAGIIAAQANNNLGISGLNKANVKVMALRVEKEEEINGKMVKHMDSEAIKDAFDYIVRAKLLGVNIVAVNCSYGGPFTLSGIEEYNELCDSLGELGIVTVIASGNESRNVDRKYYWDNDNGEYVYGDGNGPYYIGPAACTSEYAITVGATAEDGYPAGFSNYGTNVDISAPGTSILSTVNENTFQPAAYDPSTRSSLCKYYQSFENGTSIPDSELFGNIVTYTGYNKPSEYVVSSAYFFGESGHSFGVKIASGMKDKGVVFAVPFKLTNQNDAYDITLSFSSTAFSWKPKCKFFVLDKPEANAALDGVQVVGTIPSYDWNTEHYHLDPATTPGYKKSTSRELVFVILSTTDEACNVYIDCIGISKQGVSSSSYGKYDFYQGTSMATPYVAAAVALVAAAYPYTTSAERIDAIYKSARHLEQLDDEINGGKFLDLKNTGDYVPEEPTAAPTEPPTEPPTSPPTSPPTDAPTVTPTDIPGMIGLLGDTDGNDKVNIFDVSRIQKGLAGMNGYPDYQKIRSGDEFLIADVDKSGVINIFDASLIQRFLAGEDKAQGYGIGQPIAV